MCVCVCERERGILAEVGVPFIEFAIEADFVHPHLHQNRHTYTPKQTHNMSKERKNQSKDPYIRRSKPTLSLSTCPPAPARHIYTSMYVYIVANERKLCVRVCQTRPAICQKSARERNKMAHASRTLHATLHSRCTRALAAAYALLLHMCFIVVLYVSYSMRYYYICVS
jgi:hypothetical protein